MANRAGTAEEPLAETLATGLAADGGNAVLAGCVDEVPVGVMLVDRRALEDGRRWRG